MPEGMTWFDFLPGLSRIQEVLSSFAPPSVIGHRSIVVAPIAAALGIVLLLTVVAVRVRVQISNSTAALVPEPRLTLRTFVELFAETVLKLMGDVMGAKNARRFFPLIAGLAMFILFSNLIGIVPGFGSPTSNYNTCLACALIVFVATHYVGIHDHGLAYFKHFLGPVIK